MILPRSISLILILVISVPTFQALVFPRRVASIHQRYRQRADGLTSASGTRDDVTDAAIVFEKCLDTLEDAALHARRQFIDERDAGNQEVSNSVDVLAAWNAQDDERPRLLVLGSGWGAHALVKIIDTRKFRVLLVSPRPFFVFTPLLASTTVGTCEYRSITEPIRTSNPTVSFSQGACTAIDPMIQRATVVSALSSSPTPFNVTYDTLVFACGVQVSGFGVPGVDQHTHFLKEIGDAQSVRRALVDALERSLLPDTTAEERARMLTFAVVGAGATGVEFAGELTDFLRDTVRRFYPQLEPIARVLLIHSGPSILPQFDTLLRDAALRSLTDRGVEVVLESRCVRVASDHIELLRRGETSVVPCDVKVWAAGTGPRPLTEQVSVMVWHTRILSLNTHLRSKLSNAPAHRAAHRAARRRAGGRGRVRGRAAREGRRRRVPPRRRRAAGHAARARRRGGRRVDQRTRLGFLRRRRPARRRGLSAADGAGVAARQGIVRPLRLEY